MSLRRTTLVILAVAALVAGMFGPASGTPPSGVTAETARGRVVDRPLNAKVKLGEGKKQKLLVTSKGPLEIAVQRVVAKPGATFGWHTHPGLTTVTVASGTLTLYHAENCTHGIDYPAGQSFSNLSREVHLAKNNGSTDLVVFAVYFVPARTPPLELRIDQPSPGANCPS